MAAPAPREPSWIALAAAQMLLFVWLVLLALADLGGSSVGPVPPRAATATGAAVFGIMGFAVPAVLGMFPRLGPGLLGLPRPPRAVAIASAAIGALMCVAAVGWAVTGSAGFVGVQGALAAGGAAALVSTVAAGRRARTSDVRLAPPSAPIAVPANILLAGAFAYLASGGVSLSLVAWAPATVASAGLAPTFAWPLHLITAGFVALSVFGVGSRMFGSFAGVKARPALVWVIALAGVLAPAGIAAGLATFHFAWIAAFGAIALVAACAFAGLVVWMWAHQARRRRSAWMLLVAGALSLVAGESLGALFGADPALIAFAAIHGQTNALGFAGLTIFGVLFLLSGGEAARPDATFPGVWIGLLWPAALALRAIAAVAGLAAPAVLADAVLLGSFAFAARSSHPRRGPPAQPPV